jgi:NADH-quinone oxidoreductase subunit J
LDQLFSPLVLYGACVLGAVGVVLALPRRGFSPRLLGGLVAGLALGLLFLALGVKAGEHLPNFNFYLFSAIALGGALRVISHPRPVYAALYFILTILSSCGLYVLLAAEFMAFALVIVYAGAILITYLFVIMLATESPTAEQTEALSEYDRYSREPIAATVVAFVLLASLTTVLARGAAALPPPAGAAQDAALLAKLPRRVESVLRETPDAADPARMLIAADEKVQRVDVDARVATVVKSPGPSGDGPTRDVSLPANLAVHNVEGVAFSLLNDHPGSIEIAGVVLLMAMLGAVVLARKKVEMDEAAKLAAAARHLEAAKGATA